MLQQQLNGGDSKHQINKVHHVFSALIEYQHIMLDINRLI